MGVDSEKEYLEKAAVKLGLSLATLDTLVPHDRVEDIISIVSFNGCSVDKRKLPKDRSPTLREVSECVRLWPGGD